MSAKEIDKTQLLTLNADELADMVYKSMIEKDNLIKYLEDMIAHLKQCQSMAIESRYTEDAKYFNLRISSYQDILERVKSGKYE